MPLLLVILGVMSWGSPQAKSPRSEPKDVTLCELAALPQQFHQGRIRITALVSFEFEHFALADPGCEFPKGSDFQAWVAFGGDVPSGAIYCCPGEGVSGQPPAPSKNAAIPLVDDRATRNFRALLAKEGDTIVRASLVGTLLVKPDDRSPLGTMSGYGHMGCCSLFVIEQVVRFDDHNRKDLDYSSTAGGYEGRSCRNGSIDSERVWDWPKAIQLQQEADAGARRWTFDSPERVALEAARAKYGQAVTDLIRVKTIPGRQVFEWRHDRWWTTVVVSRPSWVSYFAKTKEVARMTTAINTATCAVEIRPDGDVKSQVATAFRSAFGPPVIDVRLPAGLLAGHHATFFEINRSYVVAVEFDERGWPSWVDVRPKSRYSVPTDVWDLTIFDVDALVPMTRDDYDSLIAFLDNLRTVGPASGTVRKSRNLRIQDYQHARVVWEDGSDNQHNLPGAVRAFSVTWK